jgi:hypothetical protein
MIQAFEPSKRQAAKGAGPRLIIYLSFLGLYTADKYEGALLLPFPLPPGKDGPKMNFLF